LTLAAALTPIGPSQKAIEALKNSLIHVPTYPDSNSTELRKALACYYGNITKSNIIVGNGSTELIYLFAEAFSQSGDIVLLPAPSFGEYECAVKKAGATVQHVQLDTDFHYFPQISSAP
jgi:histidinol-phosphate/aromatic aminotransferase/cobyric acid decarboxylase-like protein